MYELMLVLHSYTRWLVLIAMILATSSVWWGRLTNQAWSKWHARFGLAFSMLFTIQFIWGAILYFLPNGLVQIAWQDISAAMDVRELRFFSVEHGFQMVIALGIVHMGKTRARKAELDKTKYRWAIGAYTLATILILTAIPWWRPQFRSVNIVNTPTVPATISTDIVGDAEQGAILFTENINGQPACSTCHALDASRLVGPGLLEVATRAEERVAGQTAEEYIHTSITMPSAYVVEGFPNIMPPTYQTALSEQQLADLIAFLKTL